MKNVVNKIPVSVEPPLLLATVSGSGDTTQKLRAIGMDRAPGGTNHYAGRPTFENAKVIVNDFGADMFEKTPPGNVCPAGYIAFFYAWRAINIFLVLGNRIGDEARPSFGFNTSDKERKPYELEELQEGPQGLYFAEKIEDVEFADMGAESSEASYVTIKSNASLIAEPIASIYDIETERVFSEGLNLTLSSPGTLFPYFDNMMVPSKEYVFGLFVNYFSRCIANSPEELAQILPILRKGFRALYSTKQGVELCHAMYGIERAVYHVL
jgi:hypothetical protein